MCIIGGILVIFIHGQELQGPCNSWSVGRKLTLSNHEELSLWAGPWTAFMAWLVVLLLYVFGGLVEVRRPVGVTNLQGTVSKMCTA
jgi:hypothetical protein